jgi:hypothetical protein
MDFQYLNKCFPKDNFSALFIYQILDECARSEIFSFMDGFYCYRQKQIEPEDQHKIYFICLWGTFSYNKIPFVLENDGATFQRTMMFSFHDCKHIVETYLYDLIVHSHKRVKHMLQLRLVLERCRYYRIHLNPHKCILCVTSSCLLGFIVSTKGMMVNPLKVKAIL